jgi:hypothetical protein
MVSHLIDSTLSCKQSLIISVNAFLGLFYLEALPRFKHFLFLGRNLFVGDGGWIVVEVALGHPPLFRPFPQAGNAHFLGVAMVPVSEALPQLGGQSQDLCLEVVDLDRLSRGQPPQRCALLLKEGGVV